MKKTICIIFCTVLLFAVFLGSALYGFERIALNPTQYDRIQADLNLYDSVGMDAEALSRVNKLLADYLCGKIDDLSIEEEIVGVKQQVFNADEKAHMVDVVNLFSLAHTLRQVLLIGGIASLLLMNLFAGQKFASILMQSIKWVLMFVFGVIVLVGAAFMLGGFDAMFLGFHQMFFTNDLWLMDPATDVMIRMFPGAFFEEIVSRIGVSIYLSGMVSIVGVGMLLGANLYCLSYVGRKQKS